MRSVWLLVIVTLGVACSIFPASAQDADGDASATWDPETTWVFAVGVLDFAGDLAGWPQEGRQDAELVAQLRERGVPADQVAFLKGEDATAAKVEDAFAELLAKPGPEDMVVVYYAGHGTRGEAGGTCFTPYDYDGERRAETGWAVGSIFDSIEASFRGERAWVMADCCYSGALLAEARSRPDARVSYACLTSSSASTTSTGRWTFTECVLAALSGAPRLDLDGDGAIRLGELAEYTEAEMAFVDRQLSTFGTTGEFPASLQLGETAERLHPRVGRRVMARSDGRWYRAHVLEVKPGECLVHYADYGSEHDEWLPREDLRPWRPTHFEKGTEVEVRWRGTWYPAAVLDAKLGLHLITYDGYTSVWDEWVGPERIRRRDDGDGPAPPRAHRLRPPR